MEIAPVAGVRAVSLQRQPKVPNAQQPRFEIDPSERTEDDTWSPDRQEEDRSPEQQKSNCLDEEDSVPAEPKHEPPEGSTINVVV
jgi:hypothetical protein